VFALGKEKRQTPLPENESCETGSPVVLQPKKSAHQVREGTF
jgi:hypothetical protein